MLSGRKCLVKNPYFGTLACPAGFEELESFIALIATEPCKDDRKEPVDYFFLVITEEGLLFSTSHRYVMLVDYIFPPF